MADLCAVVYAMWVERWDAQTNAVLTAALVARAMGADVQIPDPVQLREANDAALRAEPKGEETDPDRLVLLQALGLR